MHLLPLPTKPKMLKRAKPKMLKPTKPNPLQKLLKLTKPSPLSLLLTPLLLQTLLHLPLNKVIGDI